MDFIDENYREKPKIWCSKSSTWWLIHHHVLIDHRISVKFMCKCRLEFTYSTSTYRLGCFELFQVSNLHSNRNKQRVLWLCFLVRPLYYGWMILAPWAFQSHDKKNGLLWVKEWIYYGFGCFVFPGNPEYCCEKKRAWNGEKIAWIRASKFSLLFVLTKSMVFLPMWMFTMKITQYIRVM